MTSQVEILNYDLCIDVALEAKQIVPFYIFKISSQIPGYLGERHDARQTLLEKV